MYQMHCRVCFQQFEARSVEKALALVEKHEKDMAGKPHPIKRGKG
jgi:hypothetical protein